MKLTHCFVFAVVAIAVVCSGVPVGHAYDLPTCSLNMNKGSYTLGETIRLSWVSNNANYAAFKQDTSGKDGLSLPGDKLEANGSQEINASVTGNAPVVLEVVNSYGSGSCSVIVPITDIVLTTPVQKAPTCVLNTNKSSYALGEQIKFSWTSKNATYAAFKQDISGKDTLSLPGDKLEANGSQLVLASVTGSPTVILKIYNATGSGSCSTTVLVRAAQTNTNVYQYTGGVPADVDTEASGTCLNLLNNLRYQSRDAMTNYEVSALQDFLQAKGYLNLAPTGYFGLLTMKAVQGFQQASGISPTGFVGPLTRAKIKALTCL